jgi:proteasome lid subunit RPN8/RPN11
MTFAQTIEVVMKIKLSAATLRAIEAHCEGAYPNEGAGFMLGETSGDTVVIKKLLPLENKREQEAQHNRFELIPVDFDQAEREADDQGMDLVGVFHSHPDHPAQPSEFDRDHALPNFSYLITKVAGEDGEGKAQITRAWRLRDDHTAFDEDELIAD